MKQQVKDDWIINDQNIFGLQQDIYTIICSIQFEIQDQVKGKKIKSISDYLGAKINILKEIRLGRNWTLEKVFAEFLGFEPILSLEFIKAPSQNTFYCSMILKYLQLSLSTEYSKDKHKNILTFSEYKTQYSSLLNNFLTSNIDTDEQDFIKAELALCNNLLTELNKPVYNELNLFNVVLDKPCDFKWSLTNSIDKRKKFLEEKQQPQNEALPPQQPETDKPDEDTKELHNYIFKGNAFEVFEKYHNNKSLAENSRTDLNLLFQLFQNDNLFVETVELKHYIQWLNKTYGYGLTELKKVDINSKPNIQRTNDYKEYKRTTLKQP